MPDRARVRSFESPAIAAAELLRRVRHPAAGKQDRIRQDKSTDDKPETMMITMLVLIL